MKMFVSTMHTKKKKKNALTSNHIIIIRNLKGTFATYML